MAKYHRATVDGKNYREYAYDIIVNQGMSHEDAAWKLECRFDMPESAAVSLAKRIAWNTAGFRDELTTEFEAKIQATELASTPWQQHPATEKQLSYLKNLGVNVTRQLTKSDASEIIDSVKSGNGVGTFGLTFNDGSN